jgi:hypothetical protein
MKILNWENIQELDLSFNNLDFEGFNLNDIKNSMTYIKLENVTILNSEKFSFAIFLNPKIVTETYSTIFIIFVHQVHFVV